MIVLWPKGVETLGINSSSWRRMRYLGIEDVLYLLLCLNLLVSMTVIVVKVINLEMCL